MERKKLLTCSWLVNGVGSMVTRVVMLEVEKEEKDINYCVVLVSFVSVFFYRL